MGSLSDNVITFEGNAKDYEYLIIIAENGSSYTMQMLDTKLSHPYLTSVYAGNNTGLTSKDELTSYMAYFAYSLSSNGKTMTLLKAYTNANFGVLPIRVYGVNIII